MPAEIWESLKSVPFWASLGAHPGIFYPGPLFLSCTWLWSSYDLLDLIHYLFLAGCSCPVSHQSCLPDVCVCFCKGFLCASPCQRTLPVVSHLVSLLWTYPVLHLLWPQETYHCVQRATLRHFGSLDISPLCILSSFLLQMLCSGQCCASHPGMAFLDTFSLIPWFLPGCHPAGSLPPFQLGCSRASWHQPYLLSVSTNFPSCLSY